MACSEQVEFVDIIDARKLGTLIDRANEALPAWMQIDGARDRWVDVLHVLVAALEDSPIRPGQLWLDTSDEPVVRAFCCGKWASQTADEAGDFIVCATCGTEHYTLNIRAATFTH